ncbi:ABC transporter ATP-binding protein [Aliiroseovarius sp. S253]|uniref:ABC transporter ATP-binding protein n=1 Tax=Aliiroseovarius sp. S253 TaxID=3415133 RepID=UPI003C7C7C09
MSADTPRTDQKEMIRWLWKGYMRAYRLPLALAMLLMLAEGLALGGLSYMIRPMFDVAFSSGNTSSIIWVAVIVAGIFIVRAFAAFGHRVLMVHVGQRVAAKLQTDMVAHMLTLDSSYFRDNSPGTLMERVRGDAQAIATIWEVVLAAVARDVVSLLALLGVALSIDWLWVVVAVAAAPVLTYPMGILQKRVRRTTTDSRGAAAQISTRLDEIFHGINSIKLSGTERHEQSRVDREISAFAKTHLQSQANQGAIVAMVDIIAAVGFFGVLVYGGLQINAGTKTVGEFMSFFTAMALVFDPLRNLGKVSGGWQAAIASLTRIRDVFAQSPTILSPAKPAALPGKAAQADIVLKDVNFAYGDTPILRDASFTAEAGKTTALVGASGAGKSTVFNLLTRLADAKSGEVSIGGAEVTSLPLDQLRGLFSVVSQEALLFDESLRDNILMGRDGVDEATMKHALDTAHVADFIPRLESGLDSPAGPRGSNLSGGQRQRVAIARAVLRDAPVLLLDEATSALDTKSEKLVQEALDTLAKGRTTLVIAHRLSTVRDADKIVVMDQGRVVDQGTHDELLERGGLYAQLYNLQFQDGGDASDKTSMRKGKTYLPTETKEPPRWSFRGILSGGLWRKRG